MIMFNGLTLAYMGDAYYELKVREHLLEKGFIKVNDLHQNAIKYTSAVNQAKAAMYLFDNFYNEQEINIFKRGRNQNSSHKPKNADVQTYNKATGFEAVIGFLFLSNDFARLTELIETTIKKLEETD